MEEPVKEGTECLDKLVYKLNYMLGHNEALNLVELNKSCLKTSKLCISYIESFNAEVFFILSSLSWKIKLKNWSDEEVVIDIPMPDMLVDKANRLVGSCHYANLAEKAGSEITIVEQDGKFTFNAYFRDDLSFSKVIELDDYTKAVIRQCLPCMEKVAHRLECLDKPAELNVFVNRDYLPLLTVYFQHEEDMYEYEPICSSIYRNIKIEDLKSNAKFSIDRERALFDFLNRTQ